MKDKLYSLIFFLLLSTGLILTAINIYGVFNSIRPTEFFLDELRFQQSDIKLDYDQTIEGIKRLNGESDEEYLSRVTKVIANGLAHVHWLRYDAERFNQLVPIWENFFIYAMGKLSNIPEYQRYHFADYERSLQRGIGICGDASMILSQVLNKAGIDNQIVTFPGHVLVSAQIEDKEQVYDPDFGVTLPYSLEDIRINPTKAASLYQSAGYTFQDKLIMANIFNNEYKLWKDTKHFITKKYYFEKVSYFLKWPLPIIFILIGTFGLIRLNKLLK